MIQRTKSWGQGFRVRVRVRVQGSGLRVRVRARVRAWVRVLGLRVGFNLGS